jgi:drug/metabolite transporter (DMT)-like permease
VGAARPRTRLLIALALVYVVWGSVYLAIRLLIDEVDVFQAMAQRFLAAGLILLVAVVARHGWARLRVTRGQAGILVLTGVLLLGLGNGLQALGQVKGVASGVAALIVALVPVWAGLLRLATGDRPAGLTTAGIVMGFAGLVVLVALGRGAGDSPPVIGVALVMAASLCWTVGSFVQGRGSMPEDIFVIAMYQQFVAAGCSALLAVGSGERLSVDYSARGWAAMAYLVIVCSIVGFSAFAWLLANAPLSLVATHAYVNPVVAVLLGWIVLAEPIGAPILIGGGVVVISVVLIVSSERQETPPPAPPLPANPRAHHP